MKDGFRIVKGYIKKYVITAYKRRKLQTGEFPPQVWIENTNYCNARCVMCPREQHTRPLGVMKFSLFERLIKEIALYKNTVSAVHMHNYGEPLIDKELSEKIKLAKKLGIKHVYFVTNGSLLTAEISEKLIISGLDQFKISFYGTDAETYNRTMVGLDFDKTIGNIKQFLKIRDKLKARSPKLIIQYLPQALNRSRVKQFHKIFSSLINRQLGDKLNIYSLLNFSGGRNYRDFSGRIISSICNAPWKSMLILHDGRVIVCCLDYNGVIEVGNVNHGAIKQIWNNHNYQKVRTDFKNLNYQGYSICQKCDLIF